MEVTVKSKKFGYTSWIDRIIILPDLCKPYFEVYKLEIVEYRELHCMSIYFQRKDLPDVDVVSYTIHRPEIQRNIEDGFKIAFEQLEELMNPKQLCLVLEI